MVLISNTFVLKIISVLTFIVFFKYFSYLRSHFRFLSVTVNLQVTTAHTTLSNITSGARGARVIPTRVIPTRAIPTCAIPTGVHGLP